MSVTMTKKDDEFRSLRATIQQRGTARMVVLPIVFIGWAGTAVATAAVITVAISTLVPLLILVAGFEAVFALLRGLLMLPARALGYRPAR